MKTKEIKKTGKSVVRQMRDIREKVNSEIKDMSFEQLKNYISNQKTLHPASFWQ